LTANGEAVQSEGGNGESGPRAGEGALGRLARRLLAEPRTVPQMRALRTGLRTAHVAAFAALYGGHVYGVGAERLVPALIATVATGGAFLALEVWSAPVWLVQIRGVAALVKIALVASVAALWDWRIFLLTLVMVIGVVASHMPGRYRYYSLLHWREVGDGGKG
jgi:hypothetical protein